MQRLWAWEDSDISKRAKQQTLHLRIPRGVSAFSALSLSLRGCSHRAFLETKVAPLPLRQHQVYELASGRQRIVGGDLDTHSSPASWGGIISTGFIWVILQSCRMHVQTCDIELEEITKYNRKLQHLPNNPNKTTRASYQEQTPAAIKCVKEIFTCGKRVSAASIAWLTSEAESEDSRISFYLLHTRGLRRW